MKSETKAVLSVVFGILGFISILFGLIAVYFGYKARKETNLKKGNNGFYLGITVSIINVVALITVYLILPKTLNTSYPFAAFLSESMEHNANFDDWWGTHGDWYIQNGIEREQFLTYSFKNGIYKGDLVITKGLPSDEFQIGDVLLFWSSKKEPIMHRIVKKWNEGDEIYFGTKGDHNPNQIISSPLDETKINENQIIGKVIFRISYLGYPKILYSSLLS